MQCFLYVNKIDRMSSTGGGGGGAAERRGISVTHLSIKTLREATQPKGRTAAEFCSFSRVHPAPPPHHHSTYRPALSVHNCHFVHPLCSHFFHNLLSSDFPCFSPPSKNNLTRDSFVFILWLRGLTETSVFFSSRHASITQGRTIRNLNTTRWCEYSASDHCA